MIYSYHNLNTQSFPNPRVARPSSATFCCSSRLSWSNASMILSTMAHLLKHYTIGWQQWQGKHRLCERKKSFIQHGLWSSSTYRPFRHTATILTFRVLDCLAIFADKVTNELEVVQRQLRNESTRSGRARNAEKKRLMTQRATTLERKQEELNEFIDDFFER